MTCIAGESLKVSDFDKGVGGWSSYPSTQWMQLAVGHGGDYRAVIDFRDAG
jgi:hypothetical protein